ncbi:hypothetical protein HHK36_020875 [Tetracentron sinense]|uniref:Vacuolar protein sorting-associated protein 51 homolog n=1 Tax=Tetracentron sinense TaxID=13715 RepID=A0A834YSC5_TETSI|nr:hypothetical protein HHK36_020875 [Tetracentron sinense]
MEGFSASDEFQNPLYGSNNGKNNGGCAFEGSEADSKQIKSMEDNHQINPKNLGFDKRSLGNHCSKTWVLVISNFWKDMEGGVFASDEFQVPLFGSDNGKNNGGCVFEGLEADSKRIKLMEDNHQNPLFGSDNGKNNGGCVFEGSEADSKRIKLMGDNYQGEAFLNLSREPSTLGLILKTTPSFLDLVEKLSQRSETTLVETNRSTDHEKARTRNDFAAQPIREKLKASNISASLLKNRFLGEALTRVQTRPKEGIEEECSLQVVLEASKKAVIQGSMDVSLDFRQLLDYDLDLLVKLRDLFIDWVQEGFQDFFRTLDDNFLLLSGIENSTSQDQGLIDGTRRKSACRTRSCAGPTFCFHRTKCYSKNHRGKDLPNVSSSICQEIAAAFSGGGVRGSEYRPAFVPGEMCQMFRSAGEKFLHLLEAIGIEVKQILPRGLIRKHRRSDSNRSTTSSHSNPMREDKMNRSNTQRARSHLLETHLAKLFKHKLEIFTKVEYTEESVVSTIVKLCLKSLQEFVWLQTFNRSGFQQIQLDIQFLRAPLKEIVEDEASVDFLLDEVIVAAVERCLDPIPLEPAILDKLIQAKLAKSREQNQVIHKTWKMNQFERL